MTSSGQLRRAWITAAIPLLAVILIGVLFTTLRSGGNQVASAAAQAEPVTAPTKSESTVVAATSKVPENQALASEEFSAEEIVAIVGDAVITRNDLKEAVTIDALMAELARQSPTNAAKIVEQLINTEVVLQRADGAATQQEIIAALEGLLATHSRTFDDLAAALATNDIPQERFDRYFSRLVSANAYLYSQQAAAGVAAPVLLRSWQQETRISFGSIAASLFDAVQTPTTSSEIAAAPDKGTLAQPPIEPTAESIADSITDSIVDAPAEPFDLEPDEPRGVETGQIAPDFALPELSKDFATKNLHNFRGSPSVLSFWTTWCPYCLRQTPTLVEAHRQWGEQGIQFVGVNVKEDPSVVEPYVQQHGIEYPILLDADGAVASAYAVQGYPTTYFLDKNNRIVARHVGALTKEQLQNYLLALRPAE